jgi:hypothetical protein
VTIAAVAISKNEADIVNLWAAHLFAEGVDHIYVADGRSTDGTREALDAMDNVTVFDDDEPYCYQVRWMNHLVSLAVEQGHSWLVPADLDEFFYATDGRTIADTLSTVSGDKFYARTYVHRDWNTRDVAPKRLPKVIFRWRPDAHLVMGNHDVNLPGGEYDVFDLREWQYRSFDHFVQKVHARNATLEPAARVRGDGWHHLRFEHLDEDGLRREWETMCSVPAIVDPIPSRVQGGLVPVGGDH